MGKEGKWKRRRRIREGNTWFSSTIKPLTLIPLLCVTVLEGEMKLRLPERPRLVHPFYGLPPDGLIIRDSIATAAAAAETC